MAANMLSRVIVEVVLVKEGTSTDIRTTSGPGSPIRRDWKLCSSAIDEGAVEILWASYETGVRGDGNDEAWLMEYGLAVAVEGAQSKGLTSSDARSLWAAARKWEGGAEPNTSGLPGKFSLVTGLSSSSTMTDP